MESAPVMVLVEDMELEVESLEEESSEEPPLPPAESFHQVLVLVLPHAPLPLSQPQSAKSPLQLSQVESLSSMPDAQLVSLELFSLIKNRENPLHQNSH